MERKSYSEYRPPTLISPRKLAYFFDCIINIIASFISACVVYLLMPNIYIITCLFVTLIITGSYYTYRSSKERTLIHDNGYLETFLGRFRHKMISIGDIKQVHLKKRWTLYKNYIILILELSNGKKLPICIQDNEQFLAELKSHNPNIIIPELPVL